MRTKEEIIKEVFGAGGLHGLLYHNQNNIEYAMQVYAEEYHKSELLKLNKSDVINSVSESEIRLDLDKILKAKDTFKNIL